MSTPGATRSGLIRPCAVGPRPESSRRYQPCSLGSATLPTVNAFAATPGDLTSHSLTAVLPAATTTRRPASDAAFDGQRRRVAAVGAVGILDDPERHVDDADVV